ncbi:MAG: ABC transporter ATP-binding protein [Candidatus Dormibacteraeota bacterium]|nr:ABC transporter ATP-binding protein [Candidatus Dormibacteraeota bacterium]
MSWTPGWSSVSPREPGAVSRERDAPEGGAATASRETAEAGVGDVVNTLVEVRDLHVLVGRVEAVRGVSLDLPPGRRTGLIGESGSGKTLTALALMGLLPQGLRARGSVKLEGRELLGLPERERARLRGDAMGMIFQEPLTALDPVQRIGDAIAEPLRVHRGLSAQAARERVPALLRRVHMPDPEEKMRAYPHQLSGGQRQRAMIAMAVACDPRLVIADEPTTALDVTVQARILTLLVGLVEEEGASLLLITHDLAVVSETCQDVYVMYGGRIVEQGSVDDVFSRPRHPYTAALLDAIPPVDEPVAGRRLAAIPGVVPGLGEFPTGCPFRNRCPRADQQCAQDPPLDGDGHLAACWHPVA